MPTSNLDFVQANASRRLDVQGELRQIDESTFNEETGVVTPYSEAQVERRSQLSAEIAAIDERIMQNIGEELRTQQVNAGLESLLGTMLDREGRDVRGAMPSTVGRALSDTAEYRGWSDNAGQAGHLRASLPGEFRAVTDGTLTVGSAGSLVVPPRLEGIRLETLDRPVALLDLVPHIQVSQNSVEYVQDVTPEADMVGAVAIVPEGGQKPESGVTFQVITEPIKTVAVLQNVTRQAAADVPQFVGYVDGRMRYALRRKADAQLIGGTGVGNDFVGLLNRSGINAHAPGAEARYVSIRKAITLMEQDETVPEIIVMNPADAELFDLSNQTSAGLHAMDTNGGLAMSGTRTAWGLRQVRSNAVASGTAILVDPTAVAVFDRQEITAYTTDSHGTNFAHNIITLLLEARLGIGLFTPQGICKITFNGSV